MRYCVCPRVQSSRVFGRVAVLLLYRCFHPQSLACTIPLIAGYGSVSGRKREPPNTGDSGFHRVVPRFRQAFDPSQFGIFHRAIKKKRPAEPAGLKVVTTGYVGSRDRLRPSPHSYLPLAEAQGPRRECLCSYPKWKRQRRCWSAQIGKRRSDPPGHRTGC